MPELLTHFVPGPTTRRPFLAALAITAWGCGSGPEAAQPERFVQRDSSGIVISITPGAEARAPLGWTVTSEPDLILGAGDSPAEYLTRVEGVRGLPGGEILIVDGGTAELQFHDTDGRLRRRAGGKGEGPGEFLDPVLVRTPEQDSILLFDRGIPRYQIFSPDGEGSRTIPFRFGWPSGRVPPEGAYQSLALFTQVEGIDAAMDQLGMRTLTWSYFWHESETANETMVAAHQADWTFESERRGTLDIPFAPRPSGPSTPAVL